MSRTGLWHSVTEVPRNGSRIIVHGYYCGKNDSYYEDWHIDTNDIMRWSELTEKERQIIKWVYISDLEEA